MKDFIITEDVGYYPLQYQLAVNNTANGFYQTQRFYVLPYLPKKFYNRVVYIPSIEEYKKNLKEYSKIDCREVPEYLENIIIDGLGKIKATQSKRYAAFLENIQKLDREFVLKLEEVIGKEIDKDIFINPKLCGTHISFGAGNDEIRVFARYDMSNEQIYRGIIQTVVRHVYFPEYEYIDRDRLHQISTKAKEIGQDPRILPYHTDKTMIDILQTNHCARFVPESVKYFKELGYPINSFLKDKKLHMLTHEESAMLDILKEHRNEVVSFEDIASRIWGEHNVEKFSLYALSKILERLRKKLVENGIDESVIHTQRGVGYCLYD